VTATTAAASTVPSPLKSATTARCTGVSADAALRRTPSVVDEATALDAAV